MKSVLIASVYCPSVIDWPALQTRFISKYTAAGSWDHIAWLNGTVSSTWGGMNDIQIIGGGPHGPHSDPEWLAGITAIMAYFREHADEYETFLLLDSDAWPVRHNWNLDLHRFLVERRMLYAAPMRVENLDLFPHVSALFMTRGALEANPHHLCFESRPHEDIYGNAISDVGCGLQTWWIGSLGDPVRKIWLPLLRSNAWNPHPLMAAIYGHTFYHHGAGSRHPYFRGHIGYMWNAGIHMGYEAMAGELLRDPERWICRLTASPLDMEQWWKDH